MKLTEVSAVALAPEVQAKANKIFSAVKRETPRFGKAKFELKPVSEYSAQIIVEFQRFMHPENIDDTYENITYTIEKADVDGHIKILEEAGVGSGFVEALLSGLRPGMAPVMVEAFFPTLIWDITWKKIISSKNKR